MRSTARKLHFDSTVKFTFHLVDANGTPVPKDGVKITVSRDELRNGRSRLGPRTIVQETAPDGTFEMEFYEVDQNPKGEDPGDITRLDLDVLDFGTLEVIDRTTVGLLMNDNAADDRLLDWSDEMPVITTLTLTVSEDYLVASSQSTGASNRAEAHLTDQFGSGAGRNESITFTSSDPSVTPNNTTRTANVGGNATFTYHRDSASGAIETITARHNGHTATTQQIWAAPLPENTTGSGEILLLDPTNNRALITSGPDIWLVEYTPTDHMYIGPTRVRIPTFRDALTPGATLTYQTTPHQNTYTLPTP